MKDTRLIITISLTMTCLSAKILTGCNSPSTSNPTQSSTPASYHGLSEDILHPHGDNILPDSLYLTPTLSYHRVRVDDHHSILPWYTANQGRSYDKMISLVWSFWQKMETDSNGLKYYMNHQVWRPGHDRRGLGGDQFMMALSSWNLLYDYTGDDSVIGNMKYIADYYLSHSLSHTGDAWPNIPYPYNTALHSGIYDGDMILGKGYLQPDKAGSFGYELVHLYKKTGDKKYLEAAIKIANTLAAKIQPGDGNHSPWPFKVNAATGEPGRLINKLKINKPTAGQPFVAIQPSIYTTNWTPTLGLFTELKSLGLGDTPAYAKAYSMTLNWLKTYPAKNNKWGPFFEDILGWSDCQINAITYAMYLMDNEQADPDWKNTVKNIFRWVHERLDDKEFEKYGVITTDEQTVYRTPGNSHSSREASMELRYWEKTGDTTYVRNAIRELNWATYMVNTDGRNYYIRDDIWLTDGYGDYVRHYIRVMAAAPQLAPDSGNHLLRTSSIVQHIFYLPTSIRYTTFDNISSELFRLQIKPKQVSLDGNILTEMVPPAQTTTQAGKQGWEWETFPHGGGVLSITKEKGQNVQISW